MHRKSIELGFFIAALALSAAAQTTVSNNNDGTSGTVPAYSGSATLTNSPITVSGSNVGIGTTGPTAPLEVVGTVRADQSGGGTSSAFVAASSGASYAWYLPAQDTDQKQWDALAVGTNLWFRSVNDANTQSNVWMQVNRGSGFTISGVAFPSGNVGIGTTSPGATLEVNGNIKMTYNPSNPTSLTFADGTIQTTAYTGTVCGGDYAESVDVSGDRRRYEPGDVLVIASDESRDVAKSSEAYSTAVVGIYSTKPGTVGRRHTGPKSPNEVPMAMIGIVPTKVSAENGPIHRGDLLVTSSTIGYAMKGTDRGRMLGAVIGKALGNFDSGKGVIEVVVTLQ